MKKMLALILAAAVAMSIMICGAAADGEWADYTCQEQNFSTKIPTSGTTGYDDTAKGIMIYTDVPGYIPYVIVSRRPMDMKFSNPEDYLNNVYREYIEDKFGDNNLGMNPASIWEIGGKELLGARYMYKIGDYTVVQLQLIEVRDAGDVEYTAKFIEGEDEATMAALNEAVRYYQETDAAASVEEQPAETETAQEAAPFFMTAATFVEYYNSAMTALADNYAEQLGEEGVQIVKENYIMTQTDPLGEIVYHGNNEWTVEAGFLYADAESASDTAPALVLNFTIKAGVPDGAVYLSQFVFRQMIADAFRDEISQDELNNWFDTAEGMETPFTLPGYTLNVLKTDDGQIQYSILPPASQVPQLQNIQE